MSSLFTAARLGVSKGGQLPICCTWSINIRKFIMNQLSMQEDVFWAEMLNSTTYFINVLSGILGPWRCLFDRFEMCPGSKITKAIQSTCFPMKILNQNHVKSRGPNAAQWTRILRASVVTSMWAGSSLQNIFSCNDTEKRKRGKSDVSSSSLFPRIWKTTDKLRGT